MEKQKQQPQRLQSLDALRGFDMLFIMGGASLFVALATLFPNPFFQAIAGQMEHVEWNGLAHHDTIFPLFLFIAGISFPFSLEKQRGKGILRQLNLVVSPQEQVYPQLFLQFMNRGCHRRLGNMQFLCSLRNAPAPTNAGKIFHLADLHIFSPSIFIHGVRAFALYRHDTERKKHLRRN